MKIKIALYLIIISFISFGCSGTDSGTDYDDDDEPIQLKFTYQFLSDSEGWVGDFADYMQEGEYVPDFKFMFEYSNLPFPLDETKGSLMLSSDNQSDDIFMFLKKKISGLPPNKSCQITFIVEFASDVADGTIGVGGSPGEDVFIKAGATQVEPVKELDPYDDWYRMNIDKGNQIEGGYDMIVIGDFSNDTDQDVYTLKTVMNQNYFQVESNDDGELWIVVGTDSGYEYITTIYYNKIEVIVDTYE